MESRVKLMSALGSLMLLPPPWSIGLPNASLSSSFSTFRVVIRLPALSVLLYMGMLVPSSPSKPPLLP